MKDSLELRLFPYLCRSPDKANVLKSWIKKLGETVGLYSDYLRSLAQAIQEPDNSELDSHARLVESQIPGNISYMWKTECILGPSISAFSSIDSWREFKRKIKHASTEEPGWISRSADFIRSKSLWICLFFHPDHWSLLVEENLMTEDEYINFLNMPLGSILQLPIIPLDIFRGISLLSKSSLDIPFHKILQVVLKNIKNEGIKRVSKARGLDGLLYRRRMQLISTEEAESLLRQANNLPSLPSIWVSAILRLCIEVPELNIDLLLDFWEKSEHLKPLLSFMLEEELPKNWNQLLERLLGSNRASALRLEMTIAACSKPNKTIQSSLRERLLAESNGYLNGGNASYDLYYRALLNLEPSLEEFSLWVQPETIDIIGKSPWLLDRLSNRFANAANPKSKLNHEQLRKQLSLFIAKRCDYPADIVLGALEAILKIDEANLSTLDAKMWQQCLDD